METDGAKARTRGTALGIDGGRDEGRAQASGGRAGPDAGVETRVVCGVATVPNGVLQTDDTDGAGGGLATAGKGICRGQPGFGHSGGGMKRRAWVRRGGPAR